MKKRKAHVIQTAHKLFIEKGYHATSIQDILEESGISKGSFYNYFPSKAELFKAVLKSIENELKQKRDALLVGHLPSDSTIFIQQVVLSLEIKRKNKLFQLVEDALVSNEPELISMINQSRFNFLKWVYYRFLHLFPEEKAPYLFDCAVMFSGILQHFLKINHETQDKLPLEAMVDYAMGCTTVLVEEVSRQKKQLFSPDQVPFLDTESYRHHFFNHQISVAALNLRKLIEGTVSSPSQRDEYIKLVHFIQEELLKREPRLFLIKSALLSLEQSPAIKDSPAFQTFKGALPSLEA